MVAPLVLSVTTSSRSSRPRSACVSAGRHTARQGEERGVRYDPASDRPTDIRPRATFMEEPRVGMGAWTDSGSGCLTRMTSFHRINSTNQAVPEWGLHTKSPSQRTDAVTSTDGEHVQPTLHRPNRIAGGVKSRITNVHESDRHSKRMSLRRRHRRLGLASTVQVLS